MRRMNVHQKLENYASVFCFFVVSGSLIHDKSQERLQSGLILSALCL